MKVIEKRMDEIRPIEKNVRRHPQKQIEELKRSYEAFGQYRPLVVSAEGEILVGNGLYEALKLAGVDKVDVIVLPADVPDTYKKKLMLADNKTYALGTDDLKNIDEMLAEMQDFEIPGFDEVTLRELYSGMETMPEELNNISGMGIVSGDRIEQIRKVETDRTENPPSASSAEPEPDIYEPMPSTEKRNYMNCPHCGAKIWE